MKNAMLRGAVIVLPALLVAPAAAATLKVPQQHATINDAIAAANPGVQLPRQDIIVVHRSDGSGTTFVWVDYLTKVSATWASLGPYCCQSTSITRVSGSANRASATSRTSW